MKVRTENKPAAKTEHQWTPYERQLIDKEIQQALYKQYIELFSKKAAEWVGEFQREGGDSRSLVSVLVRNYGDEIEQAKKEQWTAEFREEAEKQVNDMWQKKQKKLNEEADRLTLEMQLVSIYILHDVFGFGEGRCKKFFLESWRQSLDVKRRYQVDEDRMRWIYAERLKEDGIDLMKWSDEARREAEREDAQKPLPMTTRQTEVQFRKWARKNQK